MGFWSLFILCSLSLLYASSIASAQRTQNALLNEEADAFINQVLKDFNSPGGAAVALVRRDDQGTWVVEKKGYGAATANGNKATENTLFAIGSNSKVRGLSFHGAESKVTRFS
jgi:CubicO group peptidase (beta-lactamase class C family)